MHPTYVQITAVQVQIRRWSRPMKEDILTRHLQFVFHSASYTEHFGHLK